jgi:hypothetical protein
MPSSIMMGMLVDTVRLRLRQPSAVVSGFAKPAGRIKVLVPYWTGVLRHAG